MRPGAFRRFPMISDGWGVTGRHNLAILTPPFRRFRRFPILSDVFRYFVMLSDVSDAKV